MKHFRFPIDRVPPMKRFFQTLGLGLMLAVVPAIAQAACTVEYKAKRDATQSEPLRLTVDTMEVTSCDPSKAAAEVRARLAQDGWTLLKVLSVKE